MPLPHDSKDEPGSLLMALGTFLKNLPGRRHAVLFFLESAGLALFFHDRISSLPLLVLPGSIILAGLVLFRIFHFYAGHLARRTGDTPSSFLGHLVLGASPLILCLLLIIPRFVFLGDIRRPLLILVPGGILFLQALFRSQLKSKYPGVFKARLRPPAAPESPEPGNLSLFVFSGALVVYGVLTSGLVLPSQPLTGDEPHYLIITRSLLYDGNIDLEENYQKRDYLDFYEGALSPHTRPGKSGGWYSRHAPGLPILLAPLYFLGDQAGQAAARLAGDPGLHGRILVFSVRWGMNILAACLGLVFFKLMIVLFRDTRVSLLAWAAFAFTPPLLFYSQLIYTEIPVALICLAVFARIMRGRDDRIGPLYLSALGIALLPWLGVKYAVISLAAWLALAISVRLDRRFRIADIAALVLPAAVSGLAFLCYLWHLYGSLSPWSMYAGTPVPDALQNAGLLSSRLSSADFFHFRFEEAVRCGLAYLFDQRVGIFPYSPVFMAAPAGAALMFKKNKKAAILLLAFFVPFWIFCSLAYYWGGFCPPGRTLLPVLWVLAIFTGSALAGARTRLSFVIIRGLLFLGILVGIMGSAHPRLLYHENLSFFVSEEGKTSNLFASLSNSFIDLTRFVPHLVNQEPVFKTPLVLWLGFILVLTLILIRKGPAGDPKDHRLDLVLPSLLIMILSLLCLLYVFFNIRLDKPHPIEEGRFALHFQDDRAFPPEPDGFWTKGKTGTVVLLESPRPASAVILTLSSPVPSGIVIGIGKDTRTIRLGKDDGLEQAVVFARPVGFPWKGGYLYAVRIRSDAGFHPSRLDRTSTDGRFLGIYVRITLSESRG